MPAIQAAFADGADAVVLLNNDMEVEPGFVEPLVAALHGRPRVRLPPARRSCSPASRRASGTRAPASSGGAATTAATSATGRPPLPPTRPAVRDRPRLRRRDAVHGRDLRSASACSTRSCSPTPRTRTGRCGPGGPGSTRSSSRRASSATRSRPRRAASRRRPRSTTPCATRSSWPSGGRRSALVGTWLRRCEAVAAHAAQALLSRRRRRRPAGRARRLARLPHAAAWARVRRRISPMRGWASCTGRASGSASGTSAATATRARR